MSVKKGSKRRKKTTRKNRIVRKVLAGVLIAVLVVLIIFIFKFGSIMLQYQREAKQIIADAGENVFWEEQTSTVYDANGNLITTLKASKDALYLKLDEIPEDVQNAFIATEDREFYNHNGVDFGAVIRAVWALVQNKGEITQGGSTITQQLCKLTYLTNDVTFERKIREMFIALEIEKKYSKEEILEFYINNIYFANGYYGIEAAANGYFGKKSKDLSLSEIAFLCAIPNSPTRYDPVTNIENTLERRDRVLEQMYAQKMITDDEYLTALAAKIELHPAVKMSNNYVETYIKYCATEELMKEMGFELRYSFVDDEDRAQYDEEYAEAYDECSEKLHTGGFKIYTSIDMNMQASLQKVIDEDCAFNEEVTEDGVYAYQAAATCVDNKTGMVKAIVGGRTQDFSGYTFNRGYQAYRQPGSSIKPLIDYTPAFERGYTPDSILADYRDSEECPKNATKAYEGNIPLWYAVITSKNTTAYHLFCELGAQESLKYLTNMKFCRIVDGDYNGSASIGGLTQGVTTVEMASGFSTLVNDGIYRNPTCIIAMESKNLAINETVSEDIIYSVNSARTMTSVLKKVLTDGTGIGCAPDNAICAAKTGTTNDDFDSWFCGYSMYYTLAVWTGYDNPRSLENAAITGRIWKDYMTIIHNGLQLVDFPVVEETTDPNAAPQKEQEKKENDINQDPNAASDKEIEEIKKIEEQKRQIEEQMKENSQGGNGELSNDNNTPPGGGADPLQNVIN